MVNENSPGELGDFLRSRRARVSPEEAGVISYGRRRVAGLRREELAQLAGVSATYYTRLEQGQSSNASASVIDAIARALRLDEDERNHLYDLARPRRTKRLRPARPETVQPGMRQLLTAMTDVAAVVVGRRTEVLAWNQLGHALLAGHCDAGAPDRPADRPNLTRMLFLDQHTRELYARRPEEVNRAIASLRLVAGRHADDPELASLIGELSMKSAEFAGQWSRHPVRTCTSGSKLFRHPEVGDLQLAFEVLHLPGDAGQRLITYTAERGSPSEAALQLLKVSFSEGRDTAPTGSGHSAVHR
ncbi:helix-turn-helix transcriptional regulator [Micromonospora sp. NPDC000663]|uniref:helix-turn-helix transcriptional regulator n=1 Tax=Micromonospora sp. NPDC000663 TaxID=3364218 RepID=UPI00367C1160